MSKICELCKAENDNENQFCNTCGNPLVKKQKAAAAPKPTAAPKAVSDAHSRAKSDAKTKDATAEETKDKGGKSRKINAKFIAILGLIIVIILGVAGYFYQMNQTIKMQAEKVITDYLTEIMAGNYSKALELATGQSLSPEYEETFREFLVQLAPPMPENDRLQKAKESLGVLYDGIEKYYMINRKFPESLSELAPTCIEKLPDQPAGVEFGYTYDNSADNYTIYVKGNLFSKCGLKTDYPAFSKKDLMQSPGEIKVQSAWQIKEFKIDSVRIISNNKVKIMVTEVTQYGPQSRNDVNEYTLNNNHGKWQINVDSSNQINIMSLSLAYTQMQDMNSSTPKPSASPQSPGSGPRGRPNIEIPDIPQDPGPRPNLPPRPGGPRPGGRPGPPMPPGADPGPVPPIGVSLPVKQQLSIGTMLLSFSKIAADPRNVKLRREYQLIKCQENLDDIDLALDRFYRSNGGVYPATLQQIVPTYIKKIPENMVTMSDCFTSGYEVSNDRQTYTIYTRGWLFKGLGLEENYPIFSSVYRYNYSSAGLNSKIEKKKAEDEEKRLFEEKRNEEKALKDKENKAKKAGDTSKPPGDNNAGGRPPVGNMPNRPQ